MCDAKAIDITPSKTADALILGADEVIISTNEEQMQNVQGKFDVIIDTIPYVHNNVSKEKYIL